MPQSKSGTAPGHYPRHHLIWVDAGSWRQHILGQLDDSLDRAAQETLSAWFNAGRPAIVRRLQPQEPPEGVGLGVSLPPAKGKRRLALRLASPAITCALPPPLLSEILAAAPAAWRAALASLDAQTRAHGLELRVYGSLAWQFLTGESYVSANSDVDLLCDLRDGASWRTLVQLLLAWERTSGLRADGECIGHDDRAVAWRELARDTRQVVVKHHRGAELLPKHAVLDQVFG